MQQTWMNDRLEIPRGDLVFWATRRGNLPAADAAKRNITPSPSAVPAKTILKRIATVAWLSILLGFAMQGFVLAGKVSVGDRPALTQIAIDLAQGVTWSFFVCAGVGLGTTIAKAHRSIGGLIGLICAPIAMGLAKGSQKFVTSALNASSKEPILSLSTLGVLRAIEYALLGWALAWLVTKQEGRISRYVLAGTTTGIGFGGGITALTLYTADARDIVLPPAQIVATAINEIVFPIGCAVVVYIALKIAQQIKLLAVANEKQTA